MQLREVCDAHVIRVTLARPLRAPKPPALGFSPLFTVSPASDAIELNLGYCGRALQKLKRDEAKWPWVLGGYYGTGRGAD